MQSRKNTSSRIHALKVFIVAFCALGFGVALLALAKFLEGKSDWGWLAFWPLGEVGGILFGAGLLGIVWDYFDGKDKEIRDSERLKRILVEAAPNLRDAVVEGFAVNSDDLKRVATPGLLDDIASNAIALRLGDSDFAREIYTDLRDSAIRAPERWHDVDVRVRLSSIQAESTADATRAGLSAFAVTVTWEYTVVPSHSLKRFACTSDREEFHDLVSDVPSTSTWFMTPRPGFVASDQSSFELLEFSVDGEPRRIRRSAKRSSQVYSVNIGDDVVRGAKPVRIRHVYRTITSKSGHMLAVAIVQPTRGLTLSLDYTDTDIASMRVSDLVSSARRPRVSRLPEVTPGKLVTIDVDGWLLPQAEVSFVWSLASESQVPVEAQPMLSAGADRAA